MNDERCSDNNASPGHLSATTKPHVNEFKLYIMRECKVLAFLHSVIS